MTNEDKAAACEPDALATVLVVLVFLRVVSQMPQYMGSLRVGTVLVLTLECFSFYLFYQKYRECDTPKGFLVFVVESLLIRLLARAVHA